MAFRKWAVCRFPYNQMDSPPTSLRREIVVNLAFDIAILAKPFAADRFPERNCGAMALAFAKLRLAHSARRPTRMTQPFVEWNLPLPESVNPSGLVTDTQ